MLWSHHTLIPINTIVVNFKRNKQKDCKLIFLYFSTFVVIQFKIWEFCLHFQHVLFICSFFPLTFTNDKNENMIMMIIYEVGKRELIKKTINDLILMNSSFLCSIFIPNVRNLHRNKSKKNYCMYLLINPCNKMQKSNKLKKNMMNKCIKSLSVCVTVQSILKTVFYWLKYCI